MFERKGPVREETVPGPLLAHIRRVAVHAVWAAFFALFPDNEVE